MCRFVAIVVAALLGSLVAAGCGSSEQLEYERDLAKVGRTVDRSLEALPSSDSTTIGPAEVRRIAGDLREAADQLEDLDPPSDAVRAQARLERGLRGVATAFEDLADDLDAANSDSAQAELFVQFATDEQVETAFDDLIGAQEVYAREGYRVFGTATKDEAAPTG